MDILTEWLRAFAGLWTSPFYYVAVLFIALHLRKQTAMERKLFSVKLHTWWDEWWRILGWGAAVGAVVSIAFLFIGASLSPASLIWLWAIALLLSLFRVRYFCFAYSAGVLGLLQAVVGYAGIDPSAAAGGMAMLLDTLQEAHMPSVFALVGVLHLAEAALVWKTAGRLAVPLFLEGKRGKPVGGYQLQGFWPVPLLMLVPFGAAAGGVAGALPWPTLFGGSAWSSGWAAVAFPVLIGYQSVSITRLPQAKARQSAVRIAAFGLLVLAAGIVVYFAPYGWATAVAALLCFGLHEGITMLERRSEEIERPYFIHDDRGLKVLAVLPGSSAAELGIEPGHTIRKVNGQRVSNRAELHAAMRIHAAFTKLEVLNHDGESRLMQRALYANEHHQLGIVLCPDERALYVAAAMEDSGLFTFLRSRRSERRGGSGTAVLDRSGPPLQM
jgi:hypothetical protein